ncbi:hypothetical protein PCL_09798 [Purpureocillium lilacinum]|uniref:Uncharacterized protein n=1 Tax=Purpureocillium lilacinum TaxID=33203 RepID=A0A2U3EEA3_PURLI|nr:hypothetical protein PCL_09798 [Purpureocillium lilacinum]
MEDVLKHNYKAGGSWPGDRAISEGCRPIRGFRQDGGQPADTEGCYFQRVETKRAKMQAVKVAVRRTKDGLILATCRGPVPSGACQATGQRILKTGRSCSGDSLLPSAGWKLSFVIVNTWKDTGGFFDARKRKRRPAIPSLRQWCTRASDVSPVLRHAVAPQKALSVESTLFGDRWGAWLALQVVVSGSRGQGRGSLRSCETANGGTWTVTELILRHDSVLPHRHAEDAAGGLLEKSPRPSLRSEKQIRIGMQHAPQSTRYAEQDMDPLLASAASEPSSPTSPRAAALTHSTAYRDVGALETHLAHS